MKPAIRVESLGKRYRVNHAAPREKYRTLRESLSNVATAPLRRFRSGGHAGTTEDFWALNDVSFEVQPGEVVGIIGRNGAGKSTLLKILSRITEPTKGQIRINGRIASLLEVGTGFHPELTGRENVFLNGSILGMSQKEIARQFDDIVEFSGVESFLDTPVKRYSSGMQVRLAFAVAAHLQSEVLVIDEVLAVGDVEFQRKCMGKMEDVAQSGRTVLFVSHNMAAVQSLCTRGLMLSGGTVYRDAEIKSAIGSYLRMVESSATQSVAERTDRRGNGRVTITKIDVVNPSADASHILCSGQPAHFVFSTTEPVMGLQCAFTIYDQHGNALTHFNSRVAGEDDARSSGASDVFICEVPELLLCPGRYRLNVVLQRDSEIYDHLEGGAMIEVEEAVFHGRLIRNGATVGNIVLPHRWVIPA